MNSLIFKILFLFLLIVDGYSQKKTIHISQIESSIEIDGVLNESFWEDLEVLNLKN